MKDLVPIMLFLSIAGVIGYVAYIRHRERMELIKKGKNPFALVPSVPKTGTKSLFWGLFAVGIGLALILSAVAFQDTDRDMMTTGVVFIFGGATFLLYWRMTAKDREYARQLNEKRMEFLDRHFEESPAPVSTPVEPNEDRAAAES